MQDFEIIDNWFKKANSDLVVADICLKLIPPEIDQVCHHSFMAVEKLFKAFLTINNISFSRNHDIINLLQQCQSVDFEFDILLISCLIVVPYDSGIRYSNGFSTDFFIAKNVLKEAEKVYAFVFDKINAIIDKIIESEPKFQQFNKRSLPIRINLNLSELKLQELEDGE